LEKQRRLRHGLILKLIAGESLASQDELRRRLRHLGHRVNQATLSRDLHELRLVKTAEGYKPVTPAEAVPSRPALSRVLREFLLEMRPAQNLLVLKTPPGGAQPLAVSLEAEKWKEILGCVAGDDTILLILGSGKSRGAVAHRLQELVR